MSYVNRLILTCHGILPVPIESHSFSTIAETNKNKWDIILWLAHEWWLQIWKLYKFSTYNSSIKKWLFNEMYTTIFTSIQRLKPAYLLNKWSQLMVFCCKYSSIVMVYFLFVLFIFLYKITENSSIGICQSNPSWTLTTLLDIRVQSIWFSVS